MSNNLKIYDIKSAKHGQYYQVFIPQEIAQTIEISIDDGYGSSIVSTLTEGFYTAYCHHDIHAIGKPKYWEITGTISNSNDPIVDDSSIKGIHINDLKKLLDESPVI